MSAAPPALPVVLGVVDRLAALSGPQVGLLVRLLWLGDVPQVPDLRPYRVASAHLGDLHAVSSDPLRAVCGTFERDFLVRLAPSPFSSGLSVPDSGSYLVPLVRRLAISAGLPGAGALLPDLVVPLGVLDRVSLLPPEWWPLVVEALESMPLAAALALPGLVSS